MNLEKIKVIGFDADDTLWVNETYFRQAEEKFATLLEEYDIPHKIQEELFRVEIENLKHYGYGIKGFVLSLIETAARVSNHTLKMKVVDQILKIGKEMIHHPVELLPNVSETLASLYPHFRLVMVTKGDLMDQERKLQKSNLEKFFHHTEILSDKKEDNYLKLLSHLDIEPQQFLMVGNSLRSDIVPLVNIGANAIHIPFHTTWQHEEVDHVDHGTYLKLSNINELVQLLLKTH